LPRVVLAGSAARLLTGGVAEIDVEATTFRRLITELEARYPGLGRQVEETMAVAVDGIIYQDSYAVPFADENEIVLIPKIGGG
jgi:molybdopterin converting factor small subunit